MRIRVTNIRMGKKINNQYEKMKEKTENTDEEKIEKYRKKRIKLTNKMK